MNATDEFLPRVSFRGADLSADENYAAWRHAVATLFDVALEDEKDLGTFRADLTSYAIGSILLGHTRSVGQLFSRSTETIARSGIDHVIVQLYIAGGYRGIAGSAEIEVGAGDVCVLDCAETLETRATDFENLTLAIPRSMLESSLPRPEALHGSVLRSDTIWAQILSRHLLALFDLAPRMRIAECDRVAAGTIALVAACLRGEVEARDERTGTNVSNMVLRIRRHIDDRLADPELDADRVAAEFGLSRATLYRLFEPLGGIADYIRTRRLRRAFFALRSPDLRDRRIGEIARRSGFASMGTFTRAFKATYGLPPAALREISSIGAAKTGPDDPDRSEQGTITRWMHEITADRDPMPTKR